MINPNDTVQVTLVCAEAATVILAIIFVALAWVRGNGFRSELAGVKNERDNARKKWAIELKVVDGLSATIRAKDLLIKERDGHLADNAETIRRFQAELDATIVRFSTASNELYDAKQETVKAREALETSKAETTRARLERDQRAEARDAYMKKCEALQKQLDASKPRPAKAKKIKRKSK